MQHYVRTDTAHDLVSTLELAHVFLQGALEDDRYWKWTIFAFHSAAQSTAALALENGNGFLVQKPKTMEMMLQSHAIGGAAVQPFMDNFERLISKSLNRSNLRAEAVPLEERGHVAALNSLDELRDEFAHFNVKSWSIERAHILECLRVALEYVRHYTCLTPAILWHEQLLQPRAETAIARARVLLASG